MQHTFNYNYYGYILISMQKELNLWYIHAHANACTQKKCHTHNICHIGGGGGSYF